MNRRFIGDLLVYIGSCSSGGTYWLLFSSGFREETDWSIFGVFMKEIFPLINYGIPGFLKFIPSPYPQFVITGKNFLIQCNF